jgi:hypothetical protein
LPGLRIETPKFGTDASKPRGGFRHSAFEPRQLIRQVTYGDQPVEFCVK